MIIKKFWLTLEFVKYLKNIYKTISLDFEELIYINTLITKVLINTTTNSSEIPT